MRLLSYNILQQQFDLEALTLTAKLTRREQCSIDETYISSLFLDQSNSIRLSWPHLKKALIDISVLAYSCSGTVHLDYMQPIETLVHSIEHNELTNEILTQERLNALHQLLFEVDIIEGFIESPHLRYEIVNGDVYYRNAPLKQQ